MEINKTSQLRSFLTQHSSEVSVIVKGSAVVVATILFFFQDLSIVFMNALNDEASAYVLIVPLLFAYLVYRKRKMIRATIPAEEKGKNRSTLTLISGILLLAVSFVLYWNGSYTFTPLEYHMLLIPVFVAGMLLILFNYAVLRQLLFPLVFLFFLQPPPSQFLSSTGSALSVLSSQASTSLANLFGVATKLTSELGNPMITITRPDGTAIRFIVDITCSGIISLIGFTLFALFIAYVTRGRLLKKLTVLLIGLPIVFGLNIIRLTTIFAIGSQYGEQLALQVFHLVGASVLMFIGTILILLIREMMFKNKTITKPCPNCTTLQENTKEFCLYCGKILKQKTLKVAKSDLVKIAAITLILVMFMSIQTPVFSLTQGPAQTITQTPLGEKGYTDLLPQVNGYNLSFSYRDKQFEQTAKQDASLVYFYKPSNLNSEPITVAVEIAESKSSLHPWETCLVTWPQTHNYQPQVTQLDLKDEQILDNPPIIARFFAFKYTNTNNSQLVLYWFTSSLFTANGTDTQKQVKISLIAYPNNSEEYNQTYDQMLTVAKAITQEWEPVKTWNQIAFAISRNGLNLSAIFTILLVIVMIYYFNAKTQEKQSNKRLYNKLPINEKQLIDAVNIANGEKNPTLDNIAQHQQNLTGQKTPIEQTLAKLTAAEETGLIRANIKNNIDEPIVFWKSSIEQSKMDIVIQTWNRLINPIFTLINKIF